MKVLEQRNQYALENKISYLDFLSLLLDDEQIIPYLPDTQGVFDIAHLMYGD